MPNPNSASKRAADKAAKIAADAAMADREDAARMAAEQAENGERTGTAENPINDGAPAAGPVPSTHNLRSKWVDEINVYLAKLDTKSGESLSIWATLGKKLSKIAENFVMYEDGKKKIGANGKVVKDNNAYNDFLNKAGFINKKLANKNVRSAAKWVADNWYAVQNCPAAMKQGHPVHAQSAYNTYKGKLDDFTGPKLTELKAAWAGEGEFDADEAAAKIRDEFNQTYVEVKTSKGGGSAPHLPAYYAIQIRKWVKDGNDISKYLADSRNAWQALAQVAFEELSKAKSEIARLEADLADRDFASAAPAAEAKPKKAPKAKAKTEFGDEISDTEAKEYNAASTGDEPIDVEFSDSLKALPAPDAPAESPATQETPRSDADSEQAI